MIEFNARFGDPETEVVLPRLKSDIYDIFSAVADGRDPARPSGTTLRLWGSCWHRKDIPAPMRRGMKLRERSRWTA